MATITRQDSITNLRGTTPGVGDLAELTGYYIPGDGGGGEFYWDNASTLTDNGGTIIKATPVNGRWIRVFQDPVDVRSFGAKGDGVTDDTADINAAIGVVTSGEIIFGPNGVYIISGTLTLANPVTVNMNSATIQFPASVATTSIAAFTITSNNVTIKNGTISGTYDPVHDIPVPNAGPFGVNNLAGNSNMTIDNLTVIKVQSSGIKTANAANMTIIHSQFINTGYISLFCNNTTAGLTGGLIDGNIFDRSGITAANITQPCVAIRGSSTVNYTTNLVFTNNKVIGAISPTDLSAACMEARYVTDSTISNNVFVNSTIGLSLAADTSVTASANSCFNCIIALEVASSFSCIVPLDSNVVDGNNLAGCQGILIDGYPNATSSYNTISNNNVSNVLLNCIEVYINSTNNNIIGGVLEQDIHGGACIAIDEAQNTLISGVMMRGLTTGSYGVQLINGTILSTGTIIAGCMFMDFASAAINVYSSTTGTITGLRVMNNTSNGTMYNTLLSGATVSAPYFYGNSPEVIGSQIILATGTNASAGSSALVAGTVTVSNTLVTANSLILLSSVTPGTGARGFLSYTKTAGTSFTITSSSATDNCTVAWVIID